MVHIIDSVLQGLGVGKLYVSMCPTPTDLEGFISGPWVPINLYKSLIRIRK